MLFHESKGPRNDVEFCTSRRLLLPIYKSEEGYNSPFPPYYLGAGLSYSLRQPGQPLDKAGILPRGFPFVYSSQGRPRCKSAVTTLQAVFSGQSQQTKTPVLKIRKRASSLLPRENGFSGMITLSSAIRLSVIRTRNSASPGCPGFALVGESAYVKSSLNF
jgi:hypothetical protein